MIRDGTEPGDVRQALPWLAALETVLADPVRLVEPLHDAEDDDAAVRAVSEAFAITPEQAATVLDNQFRLLVRSRRSSVADELRVLRATWQEPIDLTLAVTLPGSGVLVLDGAEHRFTGRRLPDLLDEVTAFLRERVVDPGLQPVVVNTGLDGRHPAHLHIWPGGTSSLDYADQPDSSTPPGTGASGS